jgi:hypothetical protein
MQVAEIAVRFGDTLIDSRQLSSGSFRIGNGPGVDLATIGLTSFPLVERTERSFIVRIPTGIRATRFDDLAREATPLEGPLVLRPGDRIAVTLGALAVEISLVTRSAPLARPSIDTGWPRWIAGALIAHLLALFVIDRLADPEPEGVRVASIYSLLPRAPEPEPPPSVQARIRPRPNKKQKPQPRIAAVEPAPSEPVASEKATERRRAKAVAGARNAAGGFLGSLSADRIRAITGTKNIQKELSDVGPIYRDYEATTGQFGNGRHFEGAPSVAVGRYATISSGRGAGDYYRLPGEIGGPTPPSVEHCTGDCTATGGLHRDVVRSTIANFNQAILGCYERGGANKAGDAVISIAIGEDGKVITTDGAGLGRTGACVAGVMRRVKFPKSEPTTVRYTLSFTPASG